MLKKEKSGKPERVQLSSGGVGEKRIKNCIKTNNGCSCSSRQRQI
jgi:hypothetical protein